jgi:predicted nucleic acid-binding protein
VAGQERNAERGEMVERPSETQVQRLIFDTDILIWFFRGNKNAHRFLKRTPYPMRAISSLTIMELLQGCHNREEVREVKAFITENISTILHPEEAICHRAMRLLEQYSFSHGLKVLDSLIAATSIEASHLLATANVKHYRVIPGLSLIPFRP